ncbi:MAG: hypothetical protein JWO58_2316 [Chitinophagaceae bacterium]|nr:hypothetical protein [Chitinophagaceae bacterium]
MFRTLTTNRLFFPLLFTLVYFLLSLWGILHHEIWLDEAHSFTIARDSSSFIDLIRHTRQEGHPMLWYILLWCFMPFTHEVFYMQLLHIVITTLSVFLLTRYAPFNRIKQVLFAFSYFFFYEYNIISRNYALCFLWITWYCLLMCRDHRNYPMIALALFLLANSHFLGLIISLPLAMVSLLLLLQDENQKTKLSVWSVSIGILFIGLLLGILQVLPQKDSIFSYLPQPGYFTAERFRSFGVPFKAFYQFPDVWNVYPMNTNLFTVNKIMGGIFTLLFPFALLKAFGSKPLSLLVVVLSSLGISLFFYTGLMYNFTVRHWGFIFLCFYAAVWLQDGIDQTPYKKYLQKIHFPSFFSKENKWITQGLIYSTLLVQTLAAVYFYTLDLQRNFCNSKEVALYLQQHHYDKDLIILSGFPSGAAMSAYLDKRLYYPEYHGYGSYGLWNVLKWEVGKTELLQQIHSFPDQQRVFLLLDRHVFPDKKNATDKIVYQDNDLQIQHLASFNDGIIKNERFELYQINYFHK